MFLANALIIFNDSPSFTLLSCVHSKRSERATGPPTLMSTTCTQSLTWFIAKNLLLLHTRGRGRMELVTRHALRRPATSAWADNLDDAWRAGPSVTFCRALVRTGEVGFGTDGVAGRYGVGTVEPWWECVVRHVGRWCMGNSIPSTWATVDFRRRSRAYSWLG